MTPSKGTIRIAQVLSSSRGANSGLHLHPQGHRLVSAWCGQSGSVDFWAIDAARHLQSFAVDVELSDVGSLVGPPLMPPGADVGQDGGPVHQLPVVDSASNQLGGHVLLAAGRGGRLYRFAGDDSQLVATQTLRGHENAVTRVALDSGGEQAITADAGGQINVWDARAAKTRHILRISTVPHTVGFIWNNMLAMCGDDTGRVICWEVQHGRRHLQFQAHRGAVTRTSFNADSGVLLSAGLDGAARMWNLEEGKQIGRDMQHRSAVCDVAFAYAGRFVVTCGSDGHIAVWNSTDGDLLDWYFDGAPVYRIAFDRLHGTLIAAGARTIKLLSVDWQRLREVDANARSSGFLAEGTAADQVATFSQPPRPQPTYNPAPGQDVPVGAVMTARQTTDLPFPDRSELVVPRSSTQRQAPANPRPPQQPSKPISPVAPGPLGAAGRTGAIPTAAPAPVGAGPKATQTFGGVGGQSLAEAMASAQQRQTEQTQRATTYGIGKGGAGSNGNEAGSFFAEADAARQSARMSRVDSDLIEATNPRPPAFEPAETAAALIERVESASRSRVSSLAEIKKRDKAGRRLDPALIKRRLVIAAVAVVVVMTGARVGVSWYFTNHGWPAGVADRAAETNRELDGVVQGLENEFEDYEAEEQASITAYRRSGSMTPEAAERAIARVESRIAQRRARFERAVAEAEAERETRLSALETERRQSAVRMANLSALGAGVLALLVSLLVGLKPGNNQRRSR